MNRHKIVANLIRWSVPFLNLFRRPESWPYPLEEIQVMEKGSLGRELYNFLHGRGLGYLPKYEVHDAYHALLGYGTTVTEELKLQAFMWGNKNCTFAGQILFLLGYLVFPKKRKVLKNEMSRGRLAKPLRAFPVHEMIPNQVIKLRRDLCIN